MNKRICFAGFTGEEAASIRHAIEGNVHAWECAFAEDGPGTVAEISSEPFDAVVATLNMDGMRGDEVLQQAVKLQPDALRFIVGDTSDTSIIFSCIKDGNNFIAQTTDPGEILSAVQRGFELDTQVATERFSRIVSATSATSGTKDEKPDTDWMVRILIPATVAAVVLAVLLWWNRRSETARVLRVKAVATEPATPAAGPANPQDNTPPVSP